MPKSTSLCAWKQCSKFFHAECSYGPLYSLGTLGSIVHELFLFADGRVSQQHKNVKHKWHVSIRTKQKVRLGFLSQLGSSPFMHFPSYAFCLQVAQQFTELGPGVLLLYTQKWPKEGEKGHQHKYRDEMFSLQCNIVMHANAMRSMLSLFWGVLNSRHSMAILCPKWWD